MEGSSTNWLCKGEMARKGDGVQRAETQIASRMSGCGAMYSRWRGTTPQLPSLQAVLASVPVPVQLWLWSDPG